MPPQAVGPVSPASLQGYARDRLEAAQAVPKSLLLRRDFRLPQLDLTVWFASAAFAALCETHLVERAGAGWCRQRTEIHALDAELRGWPPPARWDEAAGFSSREFERVLAAAGLRGFYHHDAPSWQVFDPEAAVGVQSLPAALGVPPWESGAPLRLFLHWAYAAAGRRLTHAATLGMGGRGALIVGPSGSGKSGTTLAGLLNGLDSVGDDYVLVDEGPTVMAHAVFRVLKQDRAWMRRAGVDRAVVDGAPANWRGKVELDAERIAGRSLAGPMEIGAILIPEIAMGARTSIERATVPESVLALAPSAVLQLPGDAAEGFGFFSRLARRLPAFRLRLSQDPAEIAAAIAAFLTHEGGHGD